MPQPDEVRTIEEARQWFLRHAAGYVRCVNTRGDYRDCWTLAEASQFFRGASSPYDRGGNPNPASGPRYA
jgi:hypothetical protein